MTVRFREASSAAHRGPFRDRTQGAPEPALVAYSFGENLERARRIELPYAAWEAAVLPLNYARVAEVLKARAGTLEDQAKPRNRNAAAIREVKP
jgi:hypothetical protein